VGYPQSVSNIALHCLDGIWQRGCEGQRHRAGVGKIAVHHAGLDLGPHRMSPQGGPGGRGHARVAATLGGGIGGLIDPDPVSGKPIMPVVFTGVPLANYWSATTSASSGTSFTASTVLSVDFGNGLVGNSPKSSPNYVWCVRGPMSESVY